MSARNYEKKDGERRGTVGARDWFCASMTVKPAHCQINTANINNALQTPAWRFSINSEWRIDFNFVKDLLLRTTAEVFIFLYYYFLLLQSPGEQCASGRETVQLA